MIIDNFVQAVKEKAVNRKIKDVRIGLGYTGVMLDDNSCGMAYTFRNELGNCCTLFSVAGKMKGKSCEEVIEWAKDTNLAKAAVGIATINAMLQEDIKEYKCDNVFNRLDITSQDVLGVIGDFGPLTHGRGLEAKKMYVFERNVKEIDGNYYPARYIDEYMPQCDIAVVTATSLINKSFEDVIQKCQKAREITVVGPTTPLYPQAFKGYGVNILAGVLVQDPEKLLDILSQGGGTRSLGDSVKQIYIEL